MWEAVKRVVLPAFHNNSRKETAMSTKSNFKKVIPNLLEAIFDAGMGNSNGPHDCVICGESFSGYGHNPAPISYKGRCCDSCNENAVIPARVENLVNGKPIY